MVSWYVFPAKTIHSVYIRTFGKARIFPGSFFRSARYDRYDAHLEMQLGDQFFAALKMKVQDFCTVVYSYAHFLMPMMGVQFFADARMTSVDDRCVHFWQTLGSDQILRCRSESTGVALLCDLLLAIQLGDQFFAGAQNDNRGMRPVFGSTGGVQCFLRSA